MGIVKPPNLKFVEVFIDGELRSTVDVEKSPWVLELLKDFPAPSADDLECDTVQVHYVDRNANK